MENQQLENQEDMPQDSQHEENQIKKEKKDKLTKFMLYLSVFYMILLVIFSFILLFNETLQTWVLDYFNSVNSGNLNDLLILCLVGVIIILIGFPLTFYQIAFGYIIKQFWYALFLISIIKIIGFTIAFLIAKIFFRQSIEELMTGNIYFDSFTKLVKQKPMTMITLLKLMHIPSMLKNYGVGVLQVDFCDFFLPTVWTSPVLASIWINVGVQLNSIYDITKDDDEEISAQEKYWRIGLIIVTIIVFIYLTYLTKQVYDELLQEAERNKTNQEYTQLNQQENDNYQSDLNQNNNQQNNENNINNEQNPLNQKDQQQKYDIK